MLYENKNNPTEGVLLCNYKLFIQKELLLQLTITIYKKQLGVEIFEIRFMEDLEDILLY